MNWKSKRDRRYLNASNVALSWTLSSIKPPLSSFEEIGVVIPPALLISKKTQKNDFSAEKQKTQKNLLKNPKENVDPPNLIDPFIKIKKSRPRPPFSPKNCCFDFFFKFKMWKITPHFSSLSGDCARKRHLLSQKSSTPHSMEAQGPLERSQSYFSVFPQRSEHIPTGANLWELEHAWMALRQDLHIDQAWRVKSPLSSGF